MCGGAQRFGPANVNYERLVDISILIANSRRVCDHRLSQAGAITKIAVAAVLMGMAALGAAAQSKTNPEDESAQRRTRRRPWAAA
jgi:hypothetical protein